MSRHLSIRDHLERAVWRDHHTFAQRHARRRWSRRRRALAWPDRLLFVLAACLLLLLILRVEAVRAADDVEPFWGIEAGSTEDVYRVVALDTDIEIEVSGLAARVESFHTVKPLDEACLSDAFDRCEVVATIEEHSRLGGLGGAVAEWLADRPASRARLVRVGCDDAFPHEAGSQDHARRRFGLTGDAIARKVGEALSGARGGRP